VHSYVRDIQDHFNNGLDAGRDPINVESIMNAVEFRSRAEMSQPLADYLDEVAQQSETRDGERTVVVDLLFVLAAHALYVYARNYLDHKRGLDQAELRAKMLEQVDHLVGEGYARDEALAAVSAVSKIVETHPPDDSLLTTAIGLLANS
jgi:hypothetical protein